MKRVMMLLAGIAVVLASGLVYAEDTMSNDKIYRDDDIKNYDQDRGMGTVNVMPSEPITEGSGAGGSGEPAIKDPGLDKTAPADKPADKKVSEPSDSGGKTEPYKEPEYKGWDTYRY